MTSWSVRPYTEDDLDDALALAARGLGLGSVPREASFWRWKHHRNPFGPSVGLVAEESGRMVGLRLFLRWRFEKSGDVQPAVRAVDTVTAPEGRGRGLFRRLTSELVEQLAEEHAFVFNTPNEASRAGYLKMGWRDVGRVPVRVRLVRPASILSGAARGQGSEPPQRRQPPDVVWDRLGKLAERHFAAAGRWYTSRSPGYFRWRYGEAPGLDYSVEFAPGDEAAIVWRRRFRGGRVEGSISEALTVRPDAPEILAELLRSRWRERGVDYVVATAALDSVESTALRRARFVTVPRFGPRLTVRSLARSAPERWKEWRLSIGDLEVF